MRNDAELENDRFYLAFRGYGYSDLYEHFGESNFLRGTVRLMLKRPLGAGRYYQGSVCDEDFRCLERTFCQRTAKDAADWADDALRRHGIARNAEYKDRGLRERLCRNLM